MRRLAQHAVGGVVFSGLVTAVAVAGLSSPVEQGTALAAPLPVVAAPIVSVPTPTPVVVSQPPAVQAQAAARAQRAAEISRQAQRAARASDKRSATLASSGKSIAAEQKRIKAARVAAAAAAARKAREEREERERERQRAIRNRGYLPGTTDPKEMARQILKNKYDYSSEQFDCFNYIIMRESRWDVNARNPSSGAYGIPQALPGTKMASAGADWRTNPATQIIWGIDYMKKRYGSPCKAKVFKAAHGWY